jgi:hypothetical protein
MASRPPVAGGTVSLSTQEGQGGGLESERHQLEGARTQGRSGIVFEIVEIHGIDPCAGRQLFDGQTQLGAPVGDAPCEVAGKGGCRTHLAQRTARVSVPWAIWLLVSHDFIVTP